MRTTPSQYSSIFSRLRSVVGTLVIVSVCFMAACNSAQPTSTPIQSTPRPTSAPSDPDTAPMDCTPVDGAVDPMTCIASVSIQVNDAEPRPAKYDERISLQTGDVLRLVGIGYCASEQELDDRVAGEAYLFTDGVESYGSGLFTRGGSRIRAGCGIAGDFEGSWTVEPGEHRVAVVLIHYYGDTQEIDDRFFINLSVEP